ncbi:TolC family protein [Paracidovorax cattleyae]|uniref:Outer membrane protein, cobalt-zinc-cadmium efflux system n=2 Tax=Paracidovorax cattleyae TaxID=80868 RepID=A0A1H0TJF5_9BURK|nr:TolC family protein [Paracidovorax cattleyae]SDP54129.1 outer membrane protein, cobalt-zinc-cadmium efflux system [Paracidovorax cattleyae]
MRSNPPSLSLRSGAALRIAAGLLACGGAWLAGPHPAQAQATAAMPAPSQPVPAPAMAAAPRGTGWTLSQALAAARDNSEVNQARQELAGARADVLSADHAPLPNLVTKAASIDLQHGPGPGNVFTRKRIDKSIGIDWTWERGDKRALRKKAAESTANAAEADVEDTQVQQLQAALSAYYDLLAAQDRLAEVTAIERSLADVAGMADRRVKAGDLSVQDASRTRIEAERARADTRAAEQAQGDAALALAQVTGSTGSRLQAVDTPWPTLAGDPPATDADLAAWAETRADVRAALARAQAAQASLDGANALRKSDWTVGTSIDHFPGTSTRQVELRLQMPLQWGYQYQGEIGRAQADYAKAQDALDNTRRLALLDLQRLRQTQESAARRAADYDQGVLPRARQVADSAELAYRKGAIALTDLLDAQRTLRATLLDALAARADYAKARGAWLLRTRPQLLTGMP